MYYIQSVIFTIVFTRIIMRSTSVHAFKRGDGTAGEQPSKRMKIYLKINNEVEVGIDLNEEEVISLGAGFAEIFTNEDLTSSLMDTINKVVSEAKKKEEPEPEKAQEEDDAKVECTTYASDMAKYKFVKSWLKTGDITYEESTTCTGRLRMKYELSSSDVIALAKYLEDNEVDKGILI